MTFLGAMLALLLPRSAWKLIQRGKRAVWRQDRLLRHSETTEDEAAETRTPQDDHDANDDDKGDNLGSTIHSNNTHTTRGARIPKRLRRRGRREQASQPQPPGEPTGGGGDGGGRGDGDGVPDSSLNLSFRWEGMVLQDVELRRDFLAEFLGVPVDVPHASVRRIVLHLPWYTLMLGSYVAKLEGVHIVVRGGAGDAIPGDGGPGLDVQQNDPGSAPPTQGSGSSTGGGGAGNAGRQHEERPGTGRPRPLPRWMKWVLRRLKVKLTDVTVRYESVGMCPLQGAVPAGVEVTLGSLDVRPISLQGASAWFKRQVHQQQRGHQFREEMLLRELAVSVEPLVDPGPILPPRAGIAAPPNPPPPRRPRTATGGPILEKTFLLEPTTISAQAFVVSRLPPRQPPLAPGIGGGSGGVVGGDAGRAERGTTAVRAVSLHGEAWRTPRPSLLRNLPSVMRNWAQGDFLTGATEPVTLNVTEDAMTLVWGVLEEVLRLWEMRSGDGGAGGRRVAGDGEGGVSESDDDGEEDIFSEEEEWYDAFGSAMETGDQNPNRTGDSKRSAEGSASAGVPVPGSVSTAGARRGALGATVATAGKLKKKLKRPSFLKSKGSRKNGTSTGSNTSASAVGIPTRRARSSTSPSSQGTQDSGNILDGGIIALAAIDGLTLGPRAKPGLELSFNVGVTLNLVRRTAYGELGPEDHGLGFRRCRITAAGLRTGGVRDPSDGWGTPPPQHRGWLSMVSLTAGAPPFSLPGEVVTAAGSGQPSAATGQQARTVTQNENTSSITDGAMYSQTPCPWLMCRAASDVATPAAYVMDDGGGGGAQEKFLEMKVAGRAGGPSGTGSCASLVISVGKVEAWALGGAAWRWLDRLGPKPGVLPEPRSGSQDTKPREPWAPRGSFLREALFNGGCNDVIVPASSSGPRDSRRRTGGSTTTVAWPQCSLDLRGVIVHFPVDRARPFGRALRVSVGGVTALDVASSARASALNASAAGSGAATSSTLRTATAISEPSLSAPIDPPLSPKKMGVDLSVAAVGAAWTRGVAALGGHGETSDRRDARMSRRWRRAVRGEGGSVHGPGQDRGSSSPTEREIDSADGDQLVVLDVRDAFSVKVRLVDEGAAPLSTPAVPAREPARATEGGPVAEDDGDGDGDHAEGARRRRENSALLGEMAETAATRVGEEEELGVAELLPPAAVIQESLSIDVKAPPIPINISTSALTEVAWILGGFVAGDGGKDAGIDPAEPGGGGGRGGGGGGMKGRAGDGGGGRTTGRWASMMEEGHGSFTRRSSAMWRSTTSTEISPLMPVKVIYRRPSKVRRLLVRVRVASLSVHLADAARLPKVGIGPEALEDTMPWGLGAPPGHPILSMQMDGVVLAVVVREASGRRSRNRRSRRSGSKSSDAWETFTTSSLRSGGGSASGSGGARRFGPFHSSQGGVSGTGGQGMTEGAITLTVATIRSEGSDAGLDKPRGIMLPIMVASPEARVNGINGGSGSGSGSHRGPARPSSSDIGEAAASTAAAADEPSSSAILRDAHNHTATARPSTKAGILAGKQQQETGTAEAVGVEEEKASRGSGDGVDRSDRTPSGTAFGPRDQDGSRGESSRGGLGAETAEAVGEEGGDRGTVPEGGVTGPAPRSTATSKAGLMVSTRWTLEPLHGPGIPGGGGGRHRRRSSRGVSIGGGGGARGGKGARSGDAAGRSGEVGVGLVKRSMEISVGRLELWPDPMILGRISHLIRGTVGAKDLSSGLARRERVRRYRRERGLNERPPGGEDAVWPPVDDPLEELTELVWPSSELPALEVHFGVQEAACLLSFHGRPLGELQLKRGLSMSVMTFRQDRQNLGRRAMECRGAARGLLLWDRTGSASGELACIISGLSEPPPSAPESTLTAAAAASAAATAPNSNPTTRAGQRASAWTVPQTTVGETVVGKALVTTSLLPSGEELEGGVSNSGIELEWSFTGRVSEAEATASRHPSPFSMGDGPASRGIAQAGITLREPRPPIFRLRFSRARIVYLQRFTMEQFCHIWQRLLPSFSSAFHRPEDSLCGSPVAILAQKAGLRWVQGCTPQLPERRRIEKACKQRPIVIECVGQDNEFHLPECSDHREGRTDALVLEIPKFCFFRPPVRRRVPGGEGIEGAAAPTTPTNRAIRSRALGLGVGEAGMDDGDSEWEEAEPTDFVFTGLFPHEMKVGQETEELLLFEDESADDGQILEHLEVREAELRAQETEESVAEQKLRQDLTEAEKSLSAAERHQRLLEVVAAAADARGDEDRGEKERNDAAMDVVAQVNRVGELKLALEERERAVALARSQLEAVRSKAAAERTAKEEKASFEAHRPTRWHELGDENRSRRTPPPRIVEPFELIPPRELPVRAWMVLTQPCRPWCNGGTEKESGMYAGVWDALGFLPNHDPMFAKEALEVTLLFDQLDLSITRGQYTMILAIIMDNFIEPWAVCPPVIEWPRRDPEVSKGVCRDALKGRRTAQWKLVHRIGRKTYYYDEYIDDIAGKTIPIYARRLKLTVSEDEEALFFAPNQGPLDHGRRDWMAERRAAEASRRALNVERQGEGEGLADSEAGREGDAIKEEKEADTAHYLKSSENEEANEGLWDESSSSLDTLEEEIQAMAANLDGFSDEEDDDDDDESGPVTPQKPPQRRNPWASSFEARTGPFIAVAGGSDVDDSSSFYSGDDLQSEGPPAKPIALIDMKEFFLAFDKKWMNSGLALCCGAGSISISDLAYEDPSDEEARGGERQPGIQLVSPLTTKSKRGGGVAAGGRASRHPGAGFGYNGPDPRVRFEPQIWYDMHIATDYKRCSVFVSDSRAVALARALTALKSFFEEPIVDFRERDRTFRPHRYVDLRPNNLDFELILVNSYVCLPESQWTCGDSPSLGGGRSGSGRAIVAHADVTLTLTWRGLPQTGPGSSLLSATALADSVYLASLSEPSPPRPGAALSLITPAFASIRLETLTASPSWRRAGPAERWAGMQGGECTRAGRKLSAAVFAAEAAAESAPIPPREAEPIPPLPTEKAAAAAAEMKEAYWEEQSAAQEPATISRSVSVVVTDVTEARLRAWRRLGRVDLHGSGLEGGVGGVDREGFGAVEARVSLSDVKFIADTSRSIGEVLGAAGVPTSVKGLRQAHRQQLLAFARARRDRSPLTVEGYAFSDPKDAIAVTGPLPEAQHKVSTFQAGVGLPDLRLNIVSNALGLPLFHFDVRRLQAALRHEAGQYLDATISATAAAGYFNQVLYRREPVIEELPVAIAVHRDETDDDPVAEEGEERRSRRGVLEAQLSLPEVLNVNVSHAMVSALRKKALAISEDRVTTGARSRQPFRMRNRCGEALALTIRTKGKGEVHFRLEDGGDDIADFGAFSSSDNAEGQSDLADVGEGIAIRSSGETLHWDSIVSAGLAETRHSLVVAMRHRDWLYVSSHACPVDAAGVHTLRMKRMDGLSPKAKSSFGRDDFRGKTTPAAIVFLVAEVRMEYDGTRVLTLRTRVSIENACPVPVRVSLCRPGARRVERNLDSGTTAHIPLALLEPDLQIYALPASASSSGTATDWAALVQSLGATERMAEMAPREKAAAEEGGNSSLRVSANVAGGGVTVQGGGQTKIFAASNASPSGGSGSEDGTRSVRHFAGAGRGANSLCGLASSGWWVLTKVMTRHDAPVPASSLANKSKGKPAVSGPGPSDLSRVYSRTPSWSELKLRRVSLTSLAGGGPLSAPGGKQGDGSGGWDAAGEAGKVEDADGAENGDWKSLTPSSASPVFEKELLQPWHPLNLAPPSPSAADDGDGDALQGGVGKGLTLSEAEEGGDDDDDSDDGSDGDSDEDPRHDALVHHSSRRKSSAAKGSTKAGSSSNIIAGWSEVELAGGIFSSVIPDGAAAASVGLSRFCLKREIRSSKGGAVENVMREVVDAPPAAPLLLPSLSTTSETPPTVSLCLRAPLVLHNLLCVPMLYRVVNRQGLLCAEGVLPVGSSLPLQRLDLCQKQYASFLVVNYPWSPFIKIHSPTSAHPQRERVKSVETRGLKVIFAGEEAKRGRELPNLHLHVAMQGRDVSIFCRLWLVNRTETVLQHRDASLAMGVDATFIGDRMPLVTQPDQQEAPSSKEVDVSSKRGRSVRAISNISEEAAMKLSLSPARPSRMLDVRDASSTPSRRSPASVGSGISSSKGQGLLGSNSRQRLSSSVTDAGYPTDRSTGGSRSRGSRIAFTVALPISHLEEIDVEIPGSDNVESLLLAVAAEAELGLLDPMDYFLCPLQPVRDDDALALAEIMTWEMDKLSLVDGQLRALKQSFGVSSGSSRPSSGYSRWDRLGFIFDDYRPIHPSTLVSNLATPWLRMCHRAELVAAAQASQWLGAVMSPGSGLDVLVGPRPSSSRRSRTLSAPAISGAASGTSSTSSTVGILSTIQAVGTRGLLSDGRAAATGSRGCSARLSETVKGVAVAADWGRAVMFSPAAVLGGFQLCSRTSDSEWCSPVDVASLKAATGGTTCISMAQEKPLTFRDSAPRKQYDVGIQVGPGEGDFRRTLVLTLVPRYVLVNALPDALEFTQAGCGGRLKGVLPPGSRQAFHWPFANQRRALSVRFQSNAAGLAEGDEWLWSGDLKLDTIGEVAVKLRAASRRGSAHGGSGSGGGNGISKEYIARVKLALVGATVTAVFERQDLRWPPYRIDNLTSLGIRYRQALSSSDATKVPAAGSGWSDGPGELPWDSLDPQAAAPYTWDQPAGESRVLTVGFEQSGKWEEREYRLDELEKHRRVSLTRTLPSLNNPRLQGEILQCRKGTLADVWRRRWGVLKGPVLFLFRDRSCKILKGVIYLGATRGRGRREGAGSDRPQRARIGQKASEKETGDILDKMGNMMEDAVGMLMGSEVLRTGDGAGKGGDVAAPAAAAVGPAGNMAVVGLDDQDDAMHADEAFALAGMMWNHMKQKADLPASSWGVEVQQLHNRLSHSFHGHDGAGGGCGGPAGAVSAGDTTGVSFLPQSLVGAGKEGALWTATSASHRSSLDHQLLQQREGERQRGGGDGTSTIPGKRLSAAPHQGLTLGEWGDVLTEMGICTPATMSPSKAKAPSGADASATEEAEASKAEQMCRQLNELGLLVLSLPTRRHTQAPIGGPTAPHVGRSQGGDAQKSAPQESSSVPDLAPPSPSAPGSSTLQALPRRDRPKRRVSIDEDLDEAENLGGGGGLRESSGGGGTEEGGRGVGRVGAGRTTRVRDRSLGSRSVSSHRTSSVDGSARRYILRRPARDVDLSPDGTEVLTVISASGAKHDLQCYSTPEALWWIEAMRDAVDADCVQALKGSGRSATGGPVTAARAVAEKNRTVLTREGSRLEGGDAIMSRLRAKVFVNVRVRADGPTKVLELVEEAGEDVEDDDGAVAAALGPQQMSAVAASKADSIVTSVYMLQMAGVGLSLVDDRPLELLYLLADGISADVTATSQHRMLSITVDWLQVDNQLPSALFPALLRPRPLPPTKRLADGSKAPVGVIQLDGLAPRPADRPPALHFFAKRRAADPNVTSPAAKTREAARSNTPKTAAGDGAGGDLSSPAGGIDAVGGRGAGEDGGQEREEREEQDIDQVVYYYDVATVWVRPVDLKVEQAVFLSLMRLREKFGVKPSRSGGSSNSISKRSGGKDSNPIGGAEDLGTLTRSLWSALGKTGDFAGSGGGGKKLDGQASVARGYWGDEETRSRLIAFADTLRAGESALSPAVFDAGGGRRSEVKIYFALMHLHPLDVRITYRSTPGSEVQDAEELTLSTMTQLDNARLCLNALQLEHAFGGRAIFAEVILKHYKMAFFAQVHNVVGSFDFLGDPVGLLSNLSTGVKDFFYEPIEGLKPDGKGFLYGLGKGGTSLVSNTMQGTFNTFNKVTGSLGDTISHLSLDTDYRRMRVRERLVQGETMAGSMAQGAKEFGRGLFEGVTGVVMQPYLGAEKEGVLGFGKGMVKGVVGVAVKPVVGVFDLGARAFEGIRNASRMEDEGDGDGPGGQQLRPQQQLQEESARPLGVIHEGITSEMSSPSARGAAAGAASRLLSTRARPPRMFGPLGEMDPFTWDAALAQAVLRAAMRDDRDTPGERIYWFRRFHIPSRRVRALVVQSDAEDDVGQGAEGRGDVSRPPRLEALVTRWIIVTDKRMLHAQEEPGWGADKEKIKALDLARFGVTFSPVSPVMGAVRVLWDAPLPSVRGLALEPAREGIKVSLLAPVKFSTDYQELPLFFYTQQGSLTARLNAIVCDPDTMSELSVLALLQASMGSEFAQSHLIRPHKHSICMQGYLTKVDEVGLLTKTTRHWYAVANGILFEYSPRKDALPDGSGSPPVPGPPAERARWRYPYTLTMVLPLSGVAIRTGRVNGNDNALKISRSQVAGGARGRDPGSLRVVSASPRLESVLKETTIDNLMLLADSYASLREWVEWLVSQSSSEGGADGRRARPGEGLRRGEVESLKTPYRDLFVACEGMDDTDAENLCTEMRAAVSTRGGGEE